MDDPNQIPLCFDLSLLFCHLTQEFIHVNSHARSCKQSLAGNERGGPIADAAANLGPFAKLEPAFQCKIDTLSAVESHVKTRVVPSRICDDILILLLHKGINTDAIIRELGRGYDERFMAEKLVAMLGVLGKEACTRDQFEARPKMGACLPSIFDSKAVDRPCGTAYQNFGAPKCM